MTREGAGASDRWIYIGRVARPHGVRGGLKLDLENPEGALLREGLVLRLERKQGPPLDVTVTRVYGQSNIDVEQVSDRDAADALRGAQVHVRRSDFPEEEDDEAYLVDLIGARVVDKEGAALGVIESFSDNGAQPLAEVRTPAERGGALVLVPFLPPIVADIDEAALLVVLDPPLGLFDDDAVEVPPEGGASGAS